MPSLNFIFLIVPILCFSPSVLASSSPSPPLDTELLLNVTAKLHRTSLLLNAGLVHSSPQFRQEIDALKLSIMRIEKVFFSREHMALWCEDPSKMIADKDIMLAAYRKDTVCPFHEKFKFEHMPLMRANGITNLTELRRHPNYMKFMVDIKKGNINFITSHHHRGYQAYLADYSAKYFYHSVERDLEKIFEKQTGKKLPIKEIFEKYKSRNINSQRRSNSISARIAFIELSETEFIPRFS